MITVGDRQEAREIARHLVEAGLGAGAQILPIDSIYRWQGDIVEDEEWLIVVKTRSDRFDAIEDRGEEPALIRGATGSDDRNGRGERAVSRLDR